LTNEKDGLIILQEIKLETEDRGGLIGGQVLENFVQYISGTVRNENDARF
jgi:hypothetical protein